MVGVEKLCGGISLLTIYSGSIAEKGVFVELSLDLRGSLNIVQR